MEYKAQKVPLGGEGIKSELETTDKVTSEQSNLSKIQDYCLSTSCCVECCILHYATKNRKIIRKKINTKNILIISHLFDEMLLRYLSRAPCAPSTFASVSSMFSSILCGHQVITFFLKECIIHPHCILTKIIYEENLLWIPFNINISTIKSDNKRSNKV